MSAAPSNPPTGQPRSFWKHLRHDRWRLFFALLLAVITWLALKNMASDRHWLTITGVQPHFQSTDARWELDIKPLPQVSIDVSTSFWNQSKGYSPDQFRLELDPTKLVPDNDLLRTVPQRTRFQLTPEYLQLPGGLTLRGFSPPYINVDWDVITSREFSIHARVQNYMPDHLDYRVEIAPSNKVWLRGPAYLLNQVRRIETEPIVIGYSQHESFSRNNTPLQIQEIISQGIRCDRDKVDLKVHITDRNERISREVTGIRLKILNRPDNPFMPATDTHAPEISVHLSGPRQELEGLQTETIIACCDASSFSAGSYKAEVKILGLPPRVTADAVSPSSLQLKMVPRPQKPPKIAKP